MDFASLDFSQFNADFSIASAAFGILACIFLLIRYPKANQTMELFRWFAISVTTAAVFDVAASFFDSLHRPQIPKKRLSLSGEPQDLYFARTYTFYVCICRIRLGWVWVGAGSGSPPYIYVIRIR